MSERERIRRARAAFFRETRRMTIVLYVGLSVIAVATGTYAVALDWRRGLAGALGGFGAVVVLFLIGRTVRLSARAARTVMVASVIVGVAAYAVVDVAVDLADLAAVAGAACGVMAGSVVSVAAIRRRLATDDRLLLREIELGFDPEQPTAWLRRKRAN